MIRPVCGQKLVPGILEFLRAHATSASAVAKNAEPANVEFVLGLAGIRNYFSVIVNGQVKHPKPAPDIYLRAASLLNADAGRCIVFEDSITGVDAASAACMQVVGVRTPVTDIRGVALSIRDFFDSRLEPWLTAAASA
jgi:HAD superfamily hydrolase (TIGR01509 family)